MPHVYSGSLSDLWYQNTIWYGIDVEAFQDSDGDGIGDFIGLTQRLDYLVSIGVNCVWLLPFYPSPNRDNGYDVSDYYGVDPRLGTLGDFVEFVRQADELGIRVIIDLVVNHTSDEHPWFRAARDDPDSRYRDYYLWVDERPEEHDKTIVFPGEQRTNWTYDRKVRKYYRHVFYEYMPDLNVANPLVVEEIFKVMGFWLELGVSGFRVDAAPFLIEESEFRQYDVEDPYAFLRDLRHFLSTRRGDAVLFAEANVEPDQLSQYFAHGNAMNLLFNFVINNGVWLAIARQQAAPIVDGFNALPAIPPMCQWANFLHTYDELDLSRLPEPEKNEVFAAFAPDDDMRIYGRGIRRRPSSMLDGDTRRVMLAYSLLFTLPGTPVLIYGDEIGMGEDLSQPGRFPTRTPMQWSDDPNGGFSTAPANRLVRPVITDGDYAYQQVNVVDGQRDRESLLNRMQHMIRSRRETPEFGCGEPRLLETGDDAVFAHRCDWRGRTAVAVHNLSGEERTVRLDLGDHGPGPIREKLADREYDAPTGEPLEVTLDGYGFRWFRVDGLRAEVI